MSILRHRQKALRLLTPSAKHLLSNCFGFQRIRRAVLAGRLGIPIALQWLESIVGYKNFPLWMVKTDELLNHRFSSGLLANSSWRCNLRRNNEQKEANDAEIISEREVWSAIRYLDPELDHSESDIAAAIAVLAIVSIVCLVMVFLHRL